MDEQITTASLAFLFGAIHAIEPGHGKTALFTYLASGKSTWRDGIAIALSSSMTHTAVVLLLAILSHNILGHHDHSNDHIINSLRYVSVAIICGIGLYIFFKKTPASCTHCDHKHEHTHNDHKTTAHSNSGHVKNSLLTSGLLGFATGLIPCPSVIVAYLSGMSSGNSLLGLKLVIFFALGMALSLISLVLLFSFGSKKLSYNMDHWSKKFNWNKIQGSIFLLIGAITLFYH